MMLGHATQLPSPELQMILIYDPCMVAEIEAEIVSLAYPKH